MEIGRRRLIAKAPTPAARGTPPAAGPPPRRETPLGGQQARLACAAWGHSLPPPGRPKAGGAPSGAASTPSVRSVGAFPLRSRYAFPAATFTLIAMMNTLKKNAITLCINAMRRTRRLTICTSDTWNVMPSTNAKYAKSQ